VAPARATRQLALIRKRLNVALGGRAAVVVVALQVFLTFRMRRVISDETKMMYISQNLMGAPSWRRRFDERRPGFARVPA
jgi:hypothetical protein